MSDGREKEVTITLTGQALERLVLSGSLGSEFKEAFESAAHAQKARAQEGLGRKLNRYFDLSDDGSESIAVADQKDVQLTIK